MPHLLSLPQVTRDNKLVFVVFNPPVNAAAPYPRAQLRDDE